MIMQPNSSRPLNGAAPRDTLSEVVSFARRNRMLLVVMPILAVFAALGFIAWYVPVYEGVVSIRIDQERSSIAVIDALKELSSGNQIYTEMAELRSRTLAEEVVDSFALHVNVMAPARTPRAELFAQLNAPRIVEPARIVFSHAEGQSFSITVDGRSAGTATVGQPAQVHDITVTLAPGALEAGRIELDVRPFSLVVREFGTLVGVARPDREANILEVRYETRDRGLARDVPNAVAQRFIERRAQVRTTQARSTVDFLNDQIASLGGQLRSAEAGLLSFREKSRVIAPQTEAEVQVQQLAEFQAMRDAAEAERSALAGILVDATDETRRPQNESVYRRLLGFPTLLKNPAAAEMLRSLTELENERARMLMQFTEADPDVQRLTGRIQAIERDLGGLISTYIAGITAQVNSYDQVLTRFAGELDRIPAEEMELARLRRQAKVTEEIYIALQTQLKEAEIVAAVEDPSVRVLDPAIWPVKPVRPNKPLSVALAVLLGIGLAFALGLLREQLDTTIRDREQLQAANDGLPVLGSIPRFGAPVRSASMWRRSPATTNHVPRTRASLALDQDAHGAVAEAYRALRTNIVFSLTDKPLHALVITSALPGEGKSTSASNLAVALMHQGKRCLLIDADMRRGVLHEIFDVPAVPGLSEVLSGMVPVKEAVRSAELQGVELPFLPRGTVPGNPAELLASQRMAGLISTFAETYDMVIIDAPPLNLVTDAAIIGAKADGVVLIARAGVTDHRAYRHALQQLKAVRAKVIGTVLNGVDLAHDSVYGKHSGVYYGEKG